MSIKQLPSLFSLALGITTPHSTWGSLTTCSWIMLSDSRYPPGSVILYKPFQALTALKKYFSDITQHFLGVSDFKIMSFSHRVVSIDVGWQAVIAPHTEILVQSPSRCRWVALTGFCYSLIYVPHKALYCREFTHTALQPLYALFEINDLWGLRKSCLFPPTCPINLAWGTDVPAYCSTMPGRENIHSHHTFK